MSNNTWGSGDRLSALLFGGGMEGTLVNFQTFPTQEGPYLRSYLNFPTTATLHNGDGHLFNR